MQIKTIGVVGAGTMGNGIAQAFAVAGHAVVMTDVAQAALDKGLKNVDGSLERLVKKEKMTAADKATTLGRITTSTKLEALGDVDLIVEAATENLTLKLDIFAKLDAAAKPGAIIASNTSSISITKLAAATKRPAQVIGMHFFNPVPVMQLVELIRGLQTSDETYAATEAISKAVGKVPVQVKNSPGFVVNRLLCPMINEAVFALGEGLATPQQIDDAMRLGCNHPIGPLALCDLIGVDVELAVMQVLFEGFKDSKYRPAPLLVEMVEAGYLGRKTGRGFYNYA
ncbi:MAG: 3-hydroxybutyryl-CoA dehydrogenase [Burkholderiales bacterium]|nr:3-hydroxybutyryl-CoA dehydrogenase [Burkholderiales bacterium]